MYNISTVSINESFLPLLGVDVTMNNNMTVKLEYRTTRVLNLSMTSIQLNESRSNDWVIGLGYKISDFKFNLFSSSSKRKVKPAKGKNNDEQQKNATQANSRSKGINHDLNMRVDFSLRSQAAITRDIASGVSSASSGNSALQLKFAADYTLSRLMTLTFYYDRQTNTPLLSSSSYPTTTRDFGLSLKFSLTR
jgi:cell surface protein SprA